MLRVRFIEEVILSSLVTRKKCWYVKLVNLHKCGVHIIGRERDTIIHALGVAVFGQQGPERGLRVDQRPKGLLPKARAQGDSVLARLTAT